MYDVGIWVKYISSARGPIVESLGTIVLKQMFWYADKMFHDMKLHTVEKFKLQNSNSK